MHTLADESELPEDVNEVLNYYLPSFSKKLARIKAETNQSGRYLVLDAKQKNELNLTHGLFPFENGFNLQVLLQSFMRSFNEEETRRKESFPQFYQYQRYPIPFRQMCYFLDKMIDFACIVLEITKYLIKNVVNIASYYFRCLEAMLLGIAISLSADDLKHEINSNHASQVIKQIYSTLTEENFSARTRLFQLCLITAALPITVSHVAVGLAFEAMDMSFILLRAGLSMVLNLPAMAFSLLPGYRSARGFINRVRLP